MTSKDDRNPQDKQWDAAVYDDSHSFVWKYGAGVMELLSARAGERILDLGCGTGHLTSKIAAAGAEVIGIDNSPDMIEQARRNYPDIKFEVADGNDFRFDEPFDAVFSNAAIHWMKDPAGVARAIYQALKAGGRMVAEFGGKGNLKAIHTALYRAIEAAGHRADPEDNFRYYPSIGEYASLLEDQGFRVTYAAHFERPTPLEGEGKGLERWMEMFASNFLKAVPDDERRRVVEEVETRVRPEIYRDGTWFADYRRIRVVAIKD